MYPHGAQLHTKNWVGQIQDGRLAAILNVKITLFTKVLGNFLSRKSYGADILHVDVPLCYLKKIMKERCCQIQNGRSAAILNVAI